LKLKDLKIKFTSALSEGYPSEEVCSFFSILSESILKYTRLETVVKADEIISEENIKKFDTATLRLIQNEPIQYIIGTTEFFGLPFNVNAHTLIPRSETEELVDWIVKDCENIENASFLDIGTGSGCIAISLAKSLANSTVTGLDFSSEALKVARKNALLNKVTINFFELDILTAQSLPKQYQIIVSNPPYVRTLEKKSMAPNVLEYEPPSALYVSNQDPLVFYRKITQLALKFLTLDGTLYFEINEYLSKEMKAMLEDEGFLTIELRKDIFGKDRLMKCSAK